MSHTVVYQFWNGRHKVAKLFEDEDGSKSVGTVRSVRCTVAEGPATQEQLRAMFQAGTELDDHYW